MPYFTEAADIQNAIAEYAQMSILWVDTEVAEYLTDKPRLSLIQVLHTANDLTGDRVTILDVLEQPELATEFVNKIVVNPSIEKVFHNAAFDLKLLGKSRAENITCTLQMAKAIPYYLLPLPNLTLKTLAEKLCFFPPVSKEEQSSDWGQRPLTSNQLNYAKMDVVYLAQIHGQLLKINQIANKEPAKEDLTALSDRYRQIEHQWKLLSTEMEHLQERIKKAMQAQNISETENFQLSSYQQTIKKIDFESLASFTQSQGMQLNFPVRLTKEIQQKIGDTLNELPVEEQESTSWRLKVKEQVDEDPPF